MKKYKTSNDEDFISIEKALDMIEPFDEYAHYDEDQEKKEDMPATFNGREKDKLVSLIFNSSPVQGSVAAPSKSTKNKFYSQARERSSRKEDGLHVSGEFFPLTIGWEDTLQYDSNLHPVTDYHEAMMNNIAMMREGEPVWSFRDRPKSQKTIRVQSFNYVQQLREFYGIDKKDRYERRILKSKITESLKRLPKKLAVRFFALEEIDKEWSKGYLHPKTYGLIKEKAEKSLRLADIEYRTKWGDPEPVRKKAIDYEVRVLWGRNETKY